MTYNDLRTHILLYRRGASTRRTLVYWITKWQSMGATL